MMNIGWSNSTGSWFSTKIALTTPALSASIWFIIFIASTIQSVSPTFTC
ncbi:secreted protein [marine sediment metagenome]|uniref:Secreted protein n=1 Tax=marine sediment metagenome TaxID=412755 RepID=A0A1B6NVH3_9ZZZZ